MDLLSEMHIVIVIVWGADFNGFAIKYIGTPQNMFKTSQKDYY